ncbi:hypothetical protein JHK85_048925 [Glycine max]|nr:hypothetical protein JHK85_048925 [Glycine max]
MCKRGHEIDETCRFSYKLTILSDLSCVLFEFTQKWFHNRFNSICSADADVRLARRIRRDTSEKGRDIGAVLDQYSKFVKPAFDDFILPTKKYADIIIPRGGDNHVAIGLTVQHIRTKLDTGYAYKIP